MGVVDDHHLETAARGLLLRQRLQAGVERLRPAVGRDDDGEPHGS
jgi:hypothetical protein